MQLGDRIEFGKYEWRVLAIQDNSALLITEYIIEQRSYHNVYKEITWAGCSLRKYLNGEFFNSFSEADKARIIPVTNKNLDNEWYGTKCGEDTQDKIFLLSIEEVTCRYFGDSSEKLYNRGKNHKYWFHGKKDENNSKRIARYSGETWGSWWWLRSMGRVGVKAVYIHGNGDIGIQGNNMLKGNLNDVLKDDISDGICAGGVRPALWLKSI